MDDKECGPVDSQGMIDLKDTLPKHTKVRKENNDNYYDIHRVDFDIYL